MDLKSLYQDLIIDHNRSPRNFRRITDATHTAEGFNPLCGDKLTLYLKVRDGHIDDVAFEGAGCAISIAAASLMTDALKGATEEHASELFGAMHELLTAPRVSAERQAAVGKLAALGGVKAYPTRVKCASLCWHTMKAALEQADAPARTE